MRTTDPASCLRPVSAARVIVIERAREEGMFVRALQSLSRPGGRVGFNSGRRTSCLMEERAGDVGRPRRAGFAVPMAAQ